MNMNADIPALHGLQANHEYGVVYKERTESQASYWAKWVLSWIFFPVGIARLVHRYAGKKILEMARSQAGTDFPDSSNIVLQVDGHDIHAKVFRANIEVTEDVKVANRQVWAVEPGLRDANLINNAVNNGISVISFDPTVTGGISRDVMNKAYRAVLHYLEKNNVHSIIGLDTEAVEHFKPQTNTHITLLKKEGMQSLSDGASLFSTSAKINKWISRLLSLLGWNIRIPDRCENARIQSVRDLSMPSIQAAVREILATPTAPPTRPPERPKRQTQRQQTRPAEDVIKDFQARSKRKL